MGCGFRRNLEVFDSIELEQCVGSCHTFMSLLQFYMSISHLLLM